MLATECLGDETWDIDINLPGLKLVPGEISGVRTSSVIKGGCPQESEEAQDEVKEISDQRSANQ